MDSYKPVAKQGSCLNQEFTKQRKINECQKRAYREEGWVVIYGDKNVEGKFTVCV